MQAPKNGFFYVLDAASGELLAADAFTEVNWADGVDRGDGAADRAPGSPLRRDG
jgi:quinohemoprotein ethanol dehydrogenase